MSSESSFELIDDQQLVLQKRLLTPFLLKKVPPVPAESERLLFPNYPTYTKPIEWILFTWLIPVMKTGYKRTLQPADLFVLNDNVKVETLAAKFHASFTRRLHRSREKHIAAKQKARGDKEVLPLDLEDFEPTPWLTAFAILETCSRQYILGLFFISIALSVQTCTPLVSKHLIAFVEYKALGLHAPVGQGVGYALGVTAMVFVSCVCLNHAFYQSTMTGAEARGILLKVLLDKSFLLAPRSRKKFPPSKITSIMSTDVSRVDLGLGFSLYLVVVPIPIGISIGILVYNIGVPALVGVGIMFAFMIFAGILGTLLFQFRTQAMKGTDMRVGYMKEVLTNLKMIKFYSWEIPYFKAIKETREREMHSLLKMAVTRGVIISVAISLTTISSLAAILVLYATALPSKRNPASIFSSVALFNLLASTFIMMPLALSAVVDAVIGMKRCSLYLASEEIPPKVDEGLSLEEKVAVSVTNGSFEWEVFDIETDDEDDKTTEKRKAQEKADKKAAKKEAKRKKKEQKKKTEVEEDLEKLDDDSDAKSAKEKSLFVIEDINFSIRKGEFVAITGSIGSGKTSLLHAIDGTMKKNSGSVQSSASLITCGVPWIQNATFQENITFGLPFDEAWYKQVIYACSLESDLDILPAGDQTEIGERGITLSGGQKARVSLARAVYANAEIILLDDVLSAVDSKVGKHIMTQCIEGLLKNKTRILATHQLSLISSAERVFVLNGDGTLSVGTLAELQQSNKAFADLMEHTKGTKEESDDAEIEEDEKVMSQRQLSQKTLESHEDEEKHYDYREKDKDGRLVEEEFKSVNAISFDVFKKYMATAASGFKFGWIIPVALSFTVLAVFFDVFTNTWLSFWVGYKFNRSDHFYIAVYAVFASLAVGMLVLHFAVLIWLTNRLARILNIEAAKGVLFIPTSYLDTTPMGRIINRFTKDTDVLDNEVGDKMAVIAFSASVVCAILIMCIIYLPWFALAVPILVLAFVALAGFYQASGREIKRLEAVQRSKVYNNFNETLTGMETIKAYNKESMFLNKNIDNINKMNEAYYITVANQRWLEITLSILGTGVALIVSFLCVFRVFHISASSVGLLLSFVLEISNMVSMLVQMYTEVEQDMNSAERIIEYAVDLPQEPAYLISETTPRPSWPEDGTIRFENVSLSYRPGLPVVLKNMNADIRPHEKIGICGRTGAGKSSIMVALFRIVELSTGKIEIDGIDILNLGLNNLRSKLSIIPQDPVLFKGTIRKNLDPFGEKTDDELWETLRRARIIDKSEIDTVKRQTAESEDMHKFHLDQTVENDGENFSLGEKQLVAFARALVRGSKVLILDEATSSVDYATDSKIQSAIAQEFADCTILCIAHRLKTIVNYDRIMVLDKGQITEFDTPWNLYISSQSTFRLMCDKSGIDASDFRRK